MAVIVSPPLSPCHISTPLSPSLDLAIPPSTTEFVTPRSLQGIDLVAAAAVLTPLSHPIIDPTSSHDYCLSHKRSRDECDDAQFATGLDPLEHQNKRLKLDDTYVPSFDDGSVITTDDQFFGVVNVALDDPLTTGLYNASDFTSPPPIPVSFSPEEIYFPADCPTPMPSTSSSLFPEQHVIVPSAAFPVEVEAATPSTPEIELVDEDAEGEIDEEYIPPITRTLQPILPRWARVHEPPLWQLICKVRVENVKRSFKTFAEFRAAVNGEPVTAAQDPPATSSPSTETSSEEDAVELIESHDDDVTPEQAEERDAFVEIRTPSDFSSDDTQSVIQERVTEELPAKAEDNNSSPDADTEMRSAFDEWSEEYESDDDEEEEDDDDDYDIELEEDDSLTSPHETVVSFNLPSAADDSTESQQGDEEEPLLEDAIRNQCVQQRMVPKGTPHRAPAWACGNLLAYRASRNLA